MKILVTLLVTVSISIAFGTEISTDIAAHHPEVQKAIESYQSTKNEFRDAHRAILKLQKRHKEVYDGLKIGDSVFKSKGLLTLGEIRYDKKTGYSLQLGFEPRDAGEGLTALIVLFDDNGIITKKSIPRYKW